MRLLCVFFILFGISSTNNVVAQLSLPIKKVGNTEYYYYEVSKKETLYSISKKLNIEISKIEETNPTVKNGLKANQTLFFPVKEFNKTDKNVVHTNSVVTHVVKRGETLYGISKNYEVPQEAIIKSNPSISDGLQAGAIIIIPQESINQDNITSNNIQPNQNEKQEIIFHTIKRGETLYSVSKLYNSTITDIIQLNPGLTPDNFKYDDVIKVKCNSAKPILVEQKSLEFIPYEVKKGETFYSIAKSYNLTSETLQEANPNLTILKKGAIINIPVTTKKSQYINPNDIDPNSDNGNLVNLEAAYQKVYKRNISDTINVAIILPFMLDKAETKSSRQYTEFYKGFLLSVDSLKRTLNKKLILHTYDNKNSQSITDSILSLPELKMMGLIIAPPNKTQFTQVSKFAKSNQIYVVNSFGVKNDEDNNEYVINTNTPASYMNAEILDWFDKTFKSYSIICVSKKGSEEKDFFTDLKKHLLRNKYNVQNVQLSYEFTPEQFSKILTPGKKYLVIPNSSSKDLLNNLIPYLKQLKNERIDVDFKLFGYPEYVTYMSEHKLDFHKIDTYIYSRFFYNNADKRTKIFEDKYRANYGEDMMYLWPRMGALGFDIGYSFLKILNQKNPFNNTVLTKVKGLQTNLYLERTSNWSGYINKNVQFIHFTKHNTIEQE